MNTTAPPRATWTSGTTEVFKTGTWRASLPRHEQRPAPCHLACPVDGDISTWIGQIRSGDSHGAWHTLVLNNPFPAVTGRVCHHPCEKACNRHAHDAALSVCALERYAGDLALANGWNLPLPAEELPGRIAVVGGGPSGLSAAYQLRRRGYQVTVVESGNHLGGLLRTGIPPYRLPRHVLDGEIDRIMRMGISVRFGCPVQGKQQLEELGEEFDAVYLATGASRPKRLGQLDYSRPWVVESASYLAQSNGGAPPSLGQRLIVIGGGSAAIDVARSARRAGHEVVVLSLEREENMPAHRDEVIQALEEGITFRGSAQVVSAEHRDGEGLQVECEVVEFRAKPFKVTPVEDGRFMLTADAIVSAIGQDPDLDGLAEVLEVRSGLVRTDPRQRTSRSRLYAGGDVASMARFVSEAIGMGKSAAQQIDAMLRETCPPGTAAARAVPFEAINKFYHPWSPRAAAGMLDAKARISSLDEVQLPLDELAAGTEAQRCFSCGNCTHCDNCFYYCPDMAISRTESGYAVAADYCKGCGLCVAECPTGSIVMLEENK